MTLSARQLFDRLVHVETLLWGRCDEELQHQTGLTLGRLEVLRVIASVDPCRVNEISTRLLITVGAASKLVDRLEASGLCQRQPNPQDRRSSLLTVTDTGHATLTQAEAILEPLLNQAFASVSLPALHDALNHIERALDPADTPT
ncbi:transcriptional regulator [Deinococcus malanensis]|uniref:Transcriptional regulator n=1 Tax=Deinococcus malanensis TaxID=1706855 RepID=A0ABQ2EZW1_9DEIO|nr:MarR family transcriptional regulator [Deinococcus malanensis]GGK33862.1 transcriptional regulator [Deinococcus malanensis]